jgi:hypothetical protein
MVLNAADLRSESDIEAHETVISLQQHIEQQVEEDSDLASRLVQLELPPGATELDEPVLTGGYESPDPEEDAGTVSRGTSSTTPGAQPSADVNYTAEGTTEIDTPVQRGFETVLSSSQVYDRVKHRKIDAASTVSTTRSRAWSVLSGLSMAQISVIAVINLP